MNPNKTISVTEASQILRVSDRQVRRYCNDDKFQSVKDGKAFVINFDSVMELLNSGQVTEETDIDDSSEKINYQEDTDMDTQSMSVMSASDVRTNGDVRSAVKEGNGHVRSMSATVEKDSDSPMSDNGQPSMSAPPAEDQFRVRIEEINRTLDQFIHTQQKQAGQIRDTLNDLFSSYAEETNKTRKTTTTLTDLLEDLGCPLH